MGPMVLVSLVLVGVTHTLELKRLLLGFGDETVWLVIAAFVLAGAVERTGFGRRIALLLVEKLGRSMLGLGYAVAGAELVLAPVVPSNTARGGGILAPTVRSLATALGSTPDRDPDRAGSYLATVGAHACCISGGDVPDRHGGERAGVARRGRRVRHRLRLDAVGVRSVRRRDSPRSRCCR